MPRYGNVDSLFYIPIARPRDQVTPVVLKGCESYSAKIIREAPVAIFAPSSTGEDPGRLHKDISRSPLAASTLSWLGRH